MQFYMHKAITTHGQWYNTVDHTVVETYFLIHVLKLCNNFRPHFSCNTNGANTTCHLPHKEYYEDSWDH